MLGLQTSQRPLHNLLNTENIRNESGILKLIARLELNNNKLHYIMQYYTCIRLRPNFT